jgi:3D (Asp-Asp-Asp) domain-containing protein
MSDEQNGTPAERSEELSAAPADVETAAPLLFEAAGRSGLRGWRLVGSLAALTGAGITAWVWLFDAWPDRDAAPGSRVSFTATAYCKGTTTAAGTAVRRGIAAADRDVLPSGSVVSLSTGDPEFDGVYTVLDTGPAVQGHVLDLYVWSCNEALAFGRRKVSATILRLGWDPRDSAPSMTDRLLHRRARRHEPDPEDTTAQPQKERSLPKATAPDAPADDAVAPGANAAAAPVEDPAADSPQPPSDAEEARSNP